MKHTPGPWRVEPANDKRYGYIYMDGGNTWIDESVRIEDAHLIAAAPELLEACNMVLGDWPSKFSNFRKKEPKYLEIIRKAIAKAEGKE